MSHRQNQEESNSEELLQQGIEGLRNGQYSSAYSTAKSLGISETTLHGPYHGQKSRQDGHVSQQLLSDSEENALAKWITTLRLTRLPPSYSIIETIADAIRADHVVSVNTPSNQLVSYPPLGKHWVPHFIKRHPHLQAVHPRRIDANRANQSTTEVIETWFNAVEKVFDKYKIDLKNVYNMDESGFNIGVI